MKRIINYFFIVTSVVLLFAACKKKDVKTTAEKVQGTWQLQSEIYHEFVNGEDHSDTTTDPTATVEFRNDGKIYIELNGEKDTATYTLSGDTQIIMDQAGIYEIKTLTSSSFVLYSKESDGADYYEETLSLKK